MARAEGLGASAPTERGHRLDRRRRADRSVLAASLLASALLHVLALGLTFDADGGDRGPRMDGVSRPLPDAVRLLELERAAPAPVVPLSEAAPPDAESPPADDPTMGGATARDATAGDPEHGPRADATDRDRRPGRAFLGPAISDPRLWRPILPSGAVDLPARAVELAAGGVGRLRSLVDSVNVDGAGVRVPEAGDMSVWTGPDGAGNRWGLSPGRIHLGAATIPICGGDFDASNCGFGVSPSRRDEYRRRVRAFVEIRMQSNHALLRERANATRARVDASRDSIGG